MYTRQLQKTLSSYLFQRKLIILYGARQVGKTTLVRTVAEQTRKAWKYLNCEEQSVREGLQAASSEALRRFLGTYPLIVLDEAQKIPDIGLKLKLLYDTHPEQQIIATGSSSFDLANKLSEPLTGRSLTFTLYPLSVAELLGPHDTILSEDQLERFLRFGSYPDIVDKTDQDAVLYLKNLQNNYLYRDILSFASIQKPAVLENLLKLVAYQLGAEVSLHQLSNDLNIHIATVDRYIDLLEKMFVVVRLPARSTNKRNEIGKKEKIYFWDIGLRNSIINQHEVLTVRPDRWSIRENFCIIERMKKLAYSHTFARSYFRRTYQQQEVDYIEEQGGSMHAYEFKRDGKKVAHRPPSQFAASYPEVPFETVHRGNYETFVV